MVWEATETERALALLAVIEELIARVDALMAEARALRLRAEETPPWGGVPGAWP